MEVEDFDFNSDDVAMVNLLMYLKYGRPHEQHNATKSSVCLGDKKPKSAKRRSKEPKDSNPRKKIKIDMSFVPCPTDIPSEYRSKYVDLKGYNLTMLLRKVLTKTDMNRSLGRLSMPQNQIVTDFVSSEELEILKDGNVKAFMIGPSLQEQEVKFRMFKMNSNVFLLQSGWNKFKSDNGLEEGDVVQIWSFRASSKLYFFLVVLRRGIEDGGNAVDEGNGSNDDGSGGGGGFNGSN